MYAQDEVNAQVCPNCNTPEKGPLKDKIVMESGGVVEKSSPNYKESNDVRNSIAEGYF